MLGLFWSRDDAHLLHHAQIVPHPPVFYGLAVAKPHEVHVVLAHRTPGRRHARKGPFMGTALMVKRPATMSPSATNSSIVKRRSGKAVRSMVASHRNDEGPRLVPGGAAWLKKSGAISSSTIETSPC